MNQRYSIQREGDGPAFIGGAPGVAAAGGAVGVVAGALVPMRWIEAASFQLYLDTITHAATPPLGTTARIGVMLLLGVGGAAVAYAIARWRHVQPLDGGITDLLDRLRGVRADDEADAPPLRSSERHPDAPARRPFSAARDIAEDGWAADWQRMSDADDDGNGDEPGELLLDAAVALPDDDAAPAAVAPVDDMETWEPDGDSLEPFDAADPLAAEDARLEALLPDVHGDEGQNPIDDYDLSPPTLGDWEQQPQQIDPVPVAAEEAPPPPVVVGAGAEPEPTLAAPAAPARDVPPPLDLSVARLDELIARLESGLTRRAQPDAAAPAPSVAAAPGVEAPTPAPQQDNDPAYPQDPALAAALRTLRRMNAAAG